MINDDKIILNRKPLDEMLFKKHIFNEEKERAYRRVKSIESARAMSH